MVGSEASLPAWGEWIEIMPALWPLELWKSLPAWGEWIEIVNLFVISGVNLVSPRMGRVD